MARTPSLLRARILFCAVAILHFTQASVAATADVPQSLWGRFVDSFVVNLGPLAIATIAVILGYVQLRNKVKFDKERFDAEAQDRKAKQQFDKQKFEAEAEDREALRRFRTTEYLRFSETSREIANSVAKNLQSDPDWARQALESAKILPYQDTIFGERSRHFQAEKQELAKQFTRYLLARCQKFADDERDVFLLIDSGTTLFPFFDHIAKLVANCRSRGENWVDRLHIVTNNLPGFEQLMKSGKRAPSDRHSRLAIQCRLLGGEALPEFAAVAGAKTLASIRSLRSEPGVVEPIFISLIVGNWIRLSETQPQVPIPMVSDTDHHDVKKALMEISDEIYVVSPLGKVFVNQNVADINAAFKAGVRTVDVRSYRPYGDLDISTDIAAKVRLITTKRADLVRLLFTHSVKIESALTMHALVKDSVFATLPLASVPHLSFPFSPVGASTDRHFAEFETEFPHEYTRNEEVLRMFVAEGSDWWREIKNWITHE